jgi:hypothetical protein
MKMILSSVEYPLRLFCEQISDEKRYPAESRTFSADRDGCFSGKEAQLVL